MQETWNRSGQKGATFAHVEVINGLVRTTLPDGTWFDLSADNATVLANLILKYATESQKD